MRAWTRAVVLAALHAQAHFGSRAAPPRERTALEPAAANLDQNLLPPALTASLAWASSNVRMVKNGTRILVTHHKTGTVMSMAAHNQLHRALRQSRRQKDLNLSLHTNDHGVADSKLAQWVVTMLCTC